MSMSEHSPTPWREYPLGAFTRLLDANGEVVATIRREKDAHMVVKATNNHDALADVLNTAALLLGCGDPYDDFEELADLFCRETGYMRPGKSDVRGFHSDDERQQRFAEWVVGKKRDIVAVLAALKEEAK